MKEIFHIKKTFSEQYTLYIDSDIKAVNAHMISKSQLRWDFTVQEIDAETTSLKIILLDHILLEANNPLIKEVASLTSAFSRLYNELALQIDGKGKIVKVTNLDFIKSKWLQTRLEMEKIAQNNPDIKNAILINDNVFNNEIKLIESIQSSEFFLLYFNKVYGRKLPGNYTENSLNLFNSANVNWGVNLKKVYNPNLSPKEILVELFSEPAILLNIGFYNRAYIQFANQIDTSKLDTSLQEKGIYRIDGETGRMIEASLVREEIADPEQLYAKLKYTFYSDEILKFKMTDETNTKKI